MNYTYMQKFILKQVNKFYNGEVTRLFCANVKIEIKVNNELFENTYQKCFIIKHQYLIYEEQLKKIISTII